MAECVIPWDVPSAGDMQQLSNENGLIAPSTRGNVGNTSGTRIHGGAAGFKEVDDLPSTSFPVQFNVSFFVPLSEGR